MNKLEGMLGDEWYKLLKDEFDKPYMKDLSDFVRSRRKAGIVYPDSGQTFTAFQTTPYSKVKVVVLGQDPYIAENQAHGMAFSVQSGKSTPSLRNIQKAIEEDCYNGLNLNQDNNLTYLAEQGVFLLNSVLTVDAGFSNSHKDRGWELFTDKVMRLLNDKLDPIVFLLFGKDAQKKAKYIDKARHCIIQTEHPVAANYQGRRWNHCQCFKYCNEYLNKNNIKTIEW